MYSIGEFSKVCGLPVKTIRFYHERGLLKPAHVEPESNYRYYDDRAVELARVIRSLRALEFSLDEIGVILAECGDDQDLVEYLSAHKTQLVEKLHHYRDLVSRIDGVIAHEREAREFLEMSERSVEIIERTIAPQWIAGIRYKGKYADCGVAFGKLGKLVGRYMAGKPFCLYYDGEYREDDADIEACFPIRKQVEVEGAEIRELPGARCVSITHHGPYDTLHQSYALIMKYVKEKGYEIELPTREIYVKGPGMIFRGNPKKYVTEILFPIRE